MGRGEIRFQLSHSRAVDRSQDFVPCAINFNQNSFGNGAASPARFGSVIGRSSKPAPQHGTAVPLACTSLLFLPGHLCRVLDVSLSTFLGRAYRIPLTMGLLLTVVLWIVSYIFPMRTVIGLLLQIGAGGILYGAGLAGTLLSSRFRRPASWHAFVELLAPK